MCLTSLPFFSYSIEASNQSDRFTIDPTTGRLSITTSLDRDTDSVIQLSVLASDSGIPPRSSSIVISIALTDINDITPTFSADLFQLDILEDKVNGSFVYQFVAVDNDEGLNGTVRQVYIFCYFQLAVGIIQSLCSVIFILQPTNYVYIERGVCQYILNKYSSRRYLDYLL